MSLIRVRDIMNPEVEEIAPDSSVLEASVQLARRHSERLVVTAAKRPVGVLTEEDLHELEKSRSFGWASIEVTKVMQAEVVGCYEETEVEDAAKLMRDRRLDELPVVNGYGALVGKVSWSDLPVTASGAGTSP